MFFLVACYATLHPALSVGRSVGPLLTFSAFLSFSSIPLLPKCSGDLLKHCSFTPARDWGSRVSGLVLFLTELKSGQKQTTWKMQMGIDSASNGANNLYNLTLANKTKSLLQLKTDFPNTSALSVVSNLIVTIVIYYMSWKKLIPAENVFCLLGVSDFSIGHSANDAKNCQTIFFFFFWFSCFFFIMVSVYKERAEFLNTTFFLKSAPGTFEIEIWHCLLTLQLVPPPLYCR